MSRVSGDPPVGPGPNSNAYPGVERPSHLPGGVQRPPSSSSSPTAPPFPTALPPTSAPPLPQLDRPPAYHDAAHNRTADLPPSYGAFTTQLEGGSCRELQRIVNRRWDELLARGHAKIDYLNTFQGRLPGRSSDSTNGCAVIAPLVGFRHIKTKGWSKLPSLHIEHVIDNDTPPILSTIRAKHCLPEGSFIVPADVHDFLFDKGYMDPNIFGGVNGGDVLSAENMGVFLQGLEDFPPSEKAAAAFFFHEHVTAVLKLGPDMAHKYEFVDSLPHHPAGKGVRISCRTVNELAVCLNWYCLSKLSATNMNFIDANNWDEQNMEFDPRTFQAFLWHAPKEDDDGPPDPPLPAMLTAYVLLIQQDDDGMLFLIVAHARREW
eukprot:CAMPEP_0185793086 /NCGR_PEP_ID=MMETSP1174-20130828/159277_1 /TAXON_ID=35687 /ORGANISM="Dictyocha speculum, Strain CCMP1381" /LENGTH=376 /DNA_ID=CAMNT_0028488193 /DNA_START=510 /DNA_END=1638 /DNA_ORIENTATION=-